MTIEVADVQAKFAEFSTTDSAVVQTAIDEAAQLINPSFYGRHADTVHLYMTAHVLKSDANAAAGVPVPPGVVQSESLDGWSASYQVGTSPSEMKAWLKATVYGQRVLVYRTQGVRVMRMGGTT